MGTNPSAALEAGAGGRGNTPSCSPQSMSVVYVMRILHGRRRDFAGLK